MKDSVKRFLLVDDDPQNNFLSKMVLKKLFGDVDVNDFLIPEDGLEFIEAEPIHDTSDGKTTLFLDINMPSMTGWEFLEKFNTFKTSLNEQYNIYILSSSVDISDINRAKANPLVIDFIQKPLKKLTLLNMFG